MHLKAPNPSPVTHFPQRGHTYNHKAAPPNSAPSMSLWGHYHSKYHWSPNHLSTTGAFVFHPYLSGIGGWTLFRVLQFPGMCSLFGQAQTVLFTASLLRLLTLDRRGSCFLIVPYLNLPLTFLFSSQSHWKPWGQGMPSVLLTVLHTRDIEIFIV